MAAVKVLGGFEAGAIGKLHHTHDVKYRRAVLESHSFHHPRRCASSCFNAFSRVDVRVEVKIPGGVEAYLIDLRGERHEPTPAIWTETYVSSILRAVLYADDPNYRLAGFRKIDPITTPESEQRFLRAAEDIFFKGQMLLSTSILDLFWMYHTNISLAAISLKGWQLGSDPEVQVATVISNHLTTAIMKYFGDGFRYEFSCYGAQASGLEVTVNVCSL